MSNKEQINTLISVGASLPPVNPYLDDVKPSDDDDEDALHVQKSKAGRKPADTSQNQPAKASPITPDPKEYIAELERPEDEGLYA